MMNYFSIKTSIFPYSFSGMHDMTTFNLCIYLFESDWSWDTRSCVSIYCRPGINNGAILETDKLQSLASVGHCIFRLVCLLGASSLNACFWLSLTRTEYHGVISPSLFSVLGPRNAGYSPCCGSN